MGNCGLILYMASLIVGFLVGSVLKFDLAGVMRKKVTVGFGLKVMLVGFLYFLVPCIFHLSCGTISKLD